MKITQCFDEYRMKFTAILEIEWSDDISRAPLNELDRALKREAARKPSSVSAQLMWLEALAARIEEGKANKITESPR